MHSQYLVTASPTRRNALSAASPRRGPVDRAGQPQHHGRRGLGVDGEVGQHVHHGRLLEQLRAEHRAVGGVVDGVGHAGPHAARRHERAVQPGHVHHLDDRAHAAALVPDEPAERVLVLDLGRGVGLVAELVLEPLQVERVAGAVGQHARHEEAGQPARGLRQGEEQVRHRRGREPLVPGQPVAAVGAGHGPGGVGPHVRAALLLGHRHAGDQPALGQRGAQLRVVLAVGQQRLVLRGQRGRSSAGRAPRRRSSRSGTDGRRRPRPRPSPSRRGPRARRAGRRPRARRAARARPRCASGRGTAAGTRPRRCDCRSGRGCAAPAGARWPAGPTAGPGRCRRAGRGHAPRPRPSRRPRGAGPRTGPGGPSCRGRPAAGPGW